MHNCCCCPCSMCLKSQMQAVLRFLPQATAELGDEGSCFLRCSPGFCTLMSRYPPFFKQLAGCLSPLYLSPVFLCPLRQEACNVLDGCMQAAYATPSCMFTPDLKEHCEATIASRRRTKGKTHKCWLELLNEKLMRVQNSWDQASHCLSQWVARNQGMPPLV